MRDDIKPMWEVDENVQGGAFSFKVNMDKIKKPGHTWVSNVLEKLCSMLKTQKHKSM